MRIKSNLSSDAQFNQLGSSLGIRSERGHNIPEVMVAVGVLGILLVSLYAGITTGFAVLRVARENLRATQILEEKMEVIRLIKWDDVKPGFIPTTFTAPFDATSPTNGSGAFAYEGTVLVTNAPVSGSYADKLRMIQIDLTWQSGNVTRHRQMTTYVSKYGLQNYIY